MAIAELDNVRQKYPQYADIDDATLANKLAQKYPAYSDLPKKVAMTSNQSNPAMQGGANSPALKTAQKNVRVAQMQDTPLATTAKGLQNTTKYLPFGNPDMKLTPRNVIGEAAKAGSLALGPVADGATYMAGQSIEDKDKPLVLAAKTAAGAAGGKLAEAALPVISKAAKFVGKTAMDLLPKPVTDRMYQLYNDAIKPRVGQFKTKGDLESYKKDHLQSTMSIKNNPNLHFEDPVTGEIYHQPRNKQDYLQAIDDTQKNVWQDKVQAMSKGATDKGVMIDTEGIIKKTLKDMTTNKNLKFVDKTAYNDAVQMVKDAPMMGRQTPEEVEDLLTKLNNKSATYWANKDKVAADAYVKLAHSLREEMESKIEGALEKGGYLDARKEYGALKRIKSDVLRSTASQVFRGDSTLGDKLLDTFAGEELVRGLLTMRPESIAMSGTTKAYQLLRQYLRNPDRKIAQMFQLADRFSPASAKGVYNNPVVASIGPKPIVQPRTMGNVSPAQIVPKQGIPYQTKSLPDKSWMNNENTEIRPQPKFEGDEGKKPIPIPKVSRSESARYQPNAPKESVMNLSKEKPDASKGVGYLTKKAKSSKNMTEFVKSQNPKNIRERKELIELYKKVKGVR